MKIAVCYDLPKDRTKNNILMDKQVNYLMKNLTAIGHEPIAAGFTGSPDKYTQTIKKVRPDLLWNLFESFNGSKPQAYLGILLLDDIGLPYTGNNSQAVLFTADSSITKTILTDAGVAVLPHYRLGDTPPSPVHGRWHLRPVHGSDEDYAVTVETLEDLQKEIVLKSLSGELYAERHIQGRVFYAPMLSTVKGMVQVGLAEESKDKSVRFTNVAVDLQAMAEMKEISARCAKVFGLKGFAMLRFVVSERGRAYVTEVDTRPVLTEDSVFCRVCEKAGISNTDILQVLIATSQMQ